jgi:hypothetical protein
MLANADMKTVSSSSERAEFVQRSLGETVATVLAIASSFAKLGELSAATSQSKLRAI